MKKHDLTKVASSRYNWILFQSDSDMVFTVLCGSVGLYTVDFPLNEDETSFYQQKGSSYLDELASIVRRDEASYRSRHIAGFHSENEEGFKS